MINPDYLKYILLALSFISVFVIILKVLQQYGISNLLSLKNLDWHFYFLAGMMFICLAFTSVLVDMYLIALLHIALALLEFTEMYKVISKQGALSSGSNR